MLQLQAVGLVTQASIWKTIISGEKEKTAAERKSWLTELIINADDEVLDAKFKRLEGETSVSSKAARDSLTIDVADAEGKLEACCEELEKIEQDEAELDKKGFFRGLFGKGASGDAVKTVNPEDEDSLDLDF